VQLVSKISNLCDPDPPTSQTDGQTDGQHAISIPRYALVHRAVKTPTRYDTDNISIADIIDDTDTIEPSLVSRTYF